MALLRYANLGIHRPDILLSKAVSGLGDFYKYLDTTRKYLESTKAVKAIAWEKLDDAQSGVWIQLVEPADNCGDFEKNLKLFLDESTAYFGLSGHLFRFHPARRFGVIRPA